MTSTRERLKEVVVSVCPHLAAETEDAWLSLIVEEIESHMAELESERMLRNLIGETLAQASLTSSQQLKVPAMTRRIFRELVAIEGLLPKARRDNVDEEEEVEDPSELGGDDELDDEKVRIVIDLGCCVLCERDMPLTLHHLIPREVHDWYRKREGKSKDELHSGIMICRDCHSAVHKFEDNKTLAAEYSTLEKLLAHPKVQQWIPYIRKQRPTNKADRRTWKQQGRRDLPPRDDDDDERH